jgi:hypothetical protein
MVLLIKALISGATEEVSVSVIELIDEGISDLANGQDFFV